MTTEREMCACCTPTVLNQAIAGLSESLREVTFVWDRAFRRFEYVAGPVESILGVARSALLGAEFSWDLLLQPYDHLTLCDRFKRLPVDPWMSVVLRPKATVRPVRLSAAVRRIAERDLVVGRIVAEAEDPGAAQAFRQAVEYAHAGLMVLDDTGRVVYANREQAALLAAAEPADLIGQPWEAFFSASAAQALKNVMLPVLAKNGQWSGRTAATRRDGREFHQWLAVSRIPGGGEAWNCQDISAQVVLEERLQASEETFRVFLNTLPVLVVIRDEEGGLEFQNTAAGEFFAREGGVSKVGTAGWLDDRFAAWGAQDRTVIAEGRRVRFDFPLQWSNEDLVFEVEKLPLRTGAEGKLHVCTMMTDMTERRLLEQEAGQAALQREEYVVMQREFISMVSHEFRTPLTSIQGVHFLLGRRVSGEAERLPPNLLPEMQRLLKMQQQAIDTLKELVDQVLLLNRLEYLGGDLELYQIELKPLFEDVVRTINLPLERPRVVLRGEIPEDYGAAVNLVQLRCALENLVSNAVKYSAPKTDVIVTVGGDHLRWWFSVADQGRGIPESDRAKLFQPFHRASNVGTVPGTGLGLAIVKRVADHHRATVAVQSEVGAGTVFRIDLPVDPTVGKSGEQGGGEVMPFVRPRHSP